MTSWKKAESLMDLITSNNWAFKGGGEKKQDIMRLWVVLQGLATIAIFLISVPIRAHCYVGAHALQGLYLVQMSSRLRGPHERKDAFHLLCLCSPFTKCG